MQAFPSGRKGNRGFAYVVGESGLDRVKAELAGWAIDGRPLVFLIGDSNEANNSSNIPVVEQVTGDDPPDESMEEILSTSVSLLLHQSSRLPVDVGDMCDVLVKQRLHVKGGVRKVIKWAQRQVKGGLREYMRLLAVHSNGRLAVRPDGMLDKQPAPPPA